MRVGITKLKRFWLRSISEFLLKEKIKFSECETPEEIKKGKCDVVIVKGYPNTGIISEEKPERSYARDNFHGKNILYFESSFFMEFPSVRVTAGGTLRLDSQFCEVPDYKQLEKIKKSYTQITDRGDRIGVMLQLPCDSSLRHYGDMERPAVYLEEIKKAIAPYPKERVLIRLHPRYNSPEFAPLTPEWHEGIKSLGVEIEEAGPTTQEFLKKCEFTMSATSTTGAESWIQGVPHIAFSEQSWAYPMNDGQNVEEWLAVLAANTYDMDDLRSGKWFRNIYGDKK